MSDFVGSRKVRFAYIAAIPIVVALVTSFFPLMDLHIAKDSAGYINGETYRGVTYPLFLNLFDPLPNPLKAAAMAQTVIFAAAAIWLAYAFARAARSESLGIVLAALLSINPITYYFNNSILTESLYQSSLCIFLAALAQVISRRNVIAFAALGIGAGLMMITRPVGIAVLPVVVAAAIAAYFIGHSRPWRGLAIALVCAFAFFAAERAVQTAVHGPERESVLDNVMFAKSGMFSVGESPYSTDDPRSDVWNFLEHDEAGAARRAIKAAPGGNLSYFMKHNFEADMLFNYKADELKALAAEAGMSPRQLMGEVAGARIAQDKGAFLWLTGSHYWAHWQPFYYAVAQDQIDTYIRENAPFPMNNASNRLTRDAYAPPAAHAIQWTLAIGWLASVGIILAAAVFIRVDWSNRDMLTLAGLSALTLQGQTLITAMFSIATVRYLAILWPATALSVCCVAAIILRSTAGKWQLADLDASGAQKDEC